MQLYYRSRADTLVEAVRRHGVEVDERVLEVVQLEEFLQLGLVSAGQTACRSHWVDAHVTALSAYLPVSL